MTMSDNFHPYHRIFKMDIGNPMWSGTRIKYTFKAYYEGLTICFEHDGAKLLFYASARYATIPMGIQKALLDRFKKYTRK